MSDEWWRIMKTIVSSRGSQGVARRKGRNCSTNGTRRHGTVPGGFKITWEFTKIMGFLRDQWSLQVDDMSWAPVKTKMTLERSYQCAVGLSRSLSSRIIINHSNHWYSCVPVCARLIIRIYDLIIPAWYYQGSNWEHSVSSFKHTFPPNCSSQFLIVHVWHLCVLRWPTNSNVVSCLHNMTCVRSSRCDAMPTVGKFLVFVGCKSRPKKTAV